jgi:hypothetical protein
MAIENSKQITSFQHLKFFNTLFGEIFIDNKYPN